MEKKLIIGIIALSIGLPLLIQQVNAQQTTAEKYTMVSNYCMEQGDTAIAKLIDLGILSPVLYNASMTCEQVLSDLATYDANQKLLKKFGDAFGDK